MSPRSRRTVAPVAGAWTAPAPQRDSLADRALGAVERRAGRAGAAAAAGVAMLALAAARVPIGLYPTFLGKSYAELSLAPFAPAADNPVAFRILTPLLGWALGLRGRGLIVLNLAIAAALLGLVYDALRRAGHPPGRALLGVAVIALSIPTLATVHYGGYTDALTYLLLLLAWRARERVPLACALFGLALSNHESAIFLFPWLALGMATGVRAPAGPRIRHALAAVGGLTIAGGAFLLVRQLLALSRPGAEYTAGYYLEPLLVDPLAWHRASDAHRALGVFAAYGLFWMLPPLAVIHRWRAGDRTGAAAIALPFPLAYAQLLVAYDTTRLLGLSVVGMVLATDALLRDDAFRARAWLPALAAANFFIPPVNVAGGVVDPMR